MKRQMATTSKNGKQRCRSGKTRFRDRAGASAALNAIKKTSSRDVVPSRSYLCPDCKGYHLTSK